MKRILFLTLVLAAVLALVAGCGAAPSPTVSDAFTFTAQPGANTGVFMVVKNNTSKVDALVSAKTTVTDRAELHTMVANPAGGMMMQQVPSIEIPANGSVELKKGSLHLMLFGLNKALNVGDTFPVTLKTQNGNEVKVNVTVRQAN